MKYLLSGTKNEKITSNVLPQCSTCLASLSPGISIKIKCPTDRSLRRRGSAVSDFGNVYLCSPSKDDLNSSRVFHSRMGAYLAVIEHIAKIKAEIKASYNQRLNRVTHNLTSLNAHCIQEVFDLVSQETLTRNISQQITSVQETILSSPSRAARTFLRIAKNNLTMKLEFVAMRFLDADAPHPVFREHLIQKVVLNVLHAFFQDFTDIGVHVKVEDSPATVLLDYDTFHVALYHVIDNATKYVMPRSGFVVRFQEGDSRVNVIFEMMSIPIPQDELARIGEEGFSGNQARHLGLAGHGLGMFRTKRLLAVNDGELLIKPNVIPSRAAKYNRIEYQQNIFVISLVQSQKGRRSAPLAVA